MSELTIFTILAVSISALSFCSYLILNALIKKLFGRSDDL
jgi:hypothetical protein